MNGAIQMNIAVQIVEAQKNVTAHDKQELERVKEQGDIRKKLQKRVNNLQQMYDSDVLQDDLPGMNKTTD